MCRRLLALDTAGRKGNTKSGSRFEVANRVAADVRLAHTEFGRPVAAAFVAPTDLIVEQQRVYAAAVRGYLALFGDRPGRSADVRFDTVLDDLGVRLVGDIGVALDTDAGCELRVLRVGERGFGQALLDDVDLRFATLRAASWVQPRTELRIVVAELLNLGIEEFTVDLGTELGPARDWARERVEQIRALAADPRPKAGRDCLGCAFVNGCIAHRGA